MYKAYPHDCPSLFGEHIQNIFTHMSFLIWWRYQQYIYISTWLALRIWWRYIYMDGPPYLVKIYLHGWPSVFSEDISTWLALHIWWRYIYMAGPPYLVKIYLHGWPSISGEDGLRKHHVIVWCMEPHFMWLSLLILWTYAEYIHSHVIPYLEKIYRVYSINCDSLFGKVI